MRKIAQSSRGAKKREIRDRIDEIKGKPKASAKVPETGSKPKRVYHTKYEAVVIVQSTTERLTKDQCIEALQDALGKAVNGTIDS